jgi:Uma2 family endonuclease
MSLPLREPGFQKRVLPISIKTWHWMVAEGLAPRRAELLRGVIVEKMSKSLLHSQLATRLFKLIQSLFGDSHWVRKEDPITTADSEPEPDISVVTGKDSDYQSHPITALLVVEVSVSTLAEDRELAEIYAEAGVSEYWIINAGGRAVETFSNPVDGRYQTRRVYQQDEAVSCGSLPGLKLDIAELFEGLGH